MATAAGFPSPISKSMFDTALKKVNSLASAIGWPSGVRSSVNHSM
jgi:hypothetical protein